MCAELMGPLNSCINFFLYNLTSRRFRKEFVRIMCAGCCKKLSDRKQRGSSYTKSVVSSETHVTGVNTSGVALSPYTMQIDGTYTTKGDNETNT